VPTGGANALVNLIIKGDPTAGLAALRGVKSELAACSTAGASVLRTSQQLGLAFMAIGAAGVAGIGVAVKTAMKFQTELADVQTQAQYTNQEMDKISDIILRTDTALSESQMLDAIKSFAFAGWDAAGALEGMRISAMAAGAYMADAGTTASALMKTLTAFNKPASEAAYTMDVLAKAAAVGEVELEDMAHFLPRVSVTAGAAGVSLEEMAASVAAVSHYSGDARLATSSLQAMYRDLAVAGYGAQLSSEGLVATLRSIVIEAGGSRKKLTELVGSAEAVDAIIALSTGDFKSLTKAIEQMGEAAGTVAEAAAVRATTLQNSLGRVRKELTSTAIAVGSEYIPALESIVKSIAGGGGDIEANAAKIRIALDMALGAGLVGLLAQSGVAVTGLAATMGAVLGVGAPAVLAVMAAVALIAGKFIDMKVVVEKQLSDLNRVMGPEMAKAAAVANAEINKLGDSPKAASFKRELAAIVKELEDARAAGKQLDETKLAEFEQQLKNITAEARRNGVNIAGAVSATHSYIVAAQATAVAVTYIKTNATWWGRVSTAVSSATAAVSNYAASVRGASNLRLQGGLVRPGEFPMGSRGVPPIGTPRNMAGNPESGLSGFSAAERAAMGLVMTDYPAALKQLDTTINQLAQTYKWAANGSDELQLAVRGAREEMQKQWIQSQGLATGLESDIEWTLKYTTTTKEQNAALHAVLKSLVEVRLAQKPLVVSTQDATKSFADMTQGFGEDWPKAVQTGLDAMDLYVREVRAVQGRLPAGSGMGPADLLELTGISTPDAGLASMGDDPVERARQMSDQTTAVFKNSNEDKARDWKQLAGQMEDTFVRSLTQGVMRGKLLFSDFTNAIGEMIVEQLIRRAVTGMIAPALEQGASALLGGSSGALGAGLIGYSLGGPLLAGAMLGSGLFDSPTNDATARRSGRDFATQFSQGFGVGAANQARRQPGGASQTVVAQNIVVNNYHPVGAGAVARRIMKEAERAKW
jgi:TP901 family phage tail tape measure protein